MPVYLHWLVSDVARNGGLIERRRVASLEEASAVAPVVVNCTGLGARTLCGDELLHPIRGQVVRIANPGLSRFIVDVDAPGGATYVIPRGNDCVLGGTAEEHAWSVAPDPATAADILTRCGRLEPRTIGATVLEHRVGLRPGRSSVRLELERAGDSVIVHNYGHGGAGVTVAWGCAEEVVRLAGAGRLA